jgi:hypothetical protein
MGAHATATVEARPAQAESATRAPAPRSAAARVLALQHQTGNRGTRAVLARCAACNGGGSARAHAEEDPELERRGAMLLRRAVQTRTLARCGAGGCACGGACGGRAHDEDELLDERLAGR